MKWYFDDVVYEPDDYRDWPSWSVLQAASLWVLEVDIDRGTSAVWAINSAGRTVWSLYLGYLEATRPFLYELLSSLAKKNYFQLELIMKQGQQRWVVDYREHCACQLLNMTGAPSNRAVRRRLRHLLEMGVLTRDGSDGLTEEDARKWAMLVAGSYRPELQ